MIIPLYLGQFFLAGLGTYARQKYGRASRNRADYLAYVIITCIIALGVFCALSGFSFSFNRRTVIYSVVFGAAIILGHVLTLVRLRVMEIMEIALISSPLSLIMTLGTGCWLFEERITWITVLRILISFLTAYLAFRGKYHGGQVRQSRLQLLSGLALTVVLVIQGVFCTVLQKAFASDPGVTDTNSMFFLTNVWMIVICLVILLVMNKGHILPLFQDFKGLGFSQYGAIVMTTVSDNLTSVLNVQILARVPMSINTPVSGALGMLSTAAVAGLIVKEKVPLIPVILAVISALLTFFEL